jgi:1-acyl-sn-glycerol-3-phosphate acyltransferase
MTVTSRTAAPPPGANNAAAPPAPGHKAEKASFMWKMAQLLVRVWTTVTFDLKVYGLNNVPRTGGVLMVSNHQSLLDPLLLGARLRRPMSYMAKSELFTNKAFGRLIRSVGAFPVRQGAGDVGAIRETVARLQEGRMLNIFPEGARTEDGQIGPMQPGVALVVRRAGVPIVPVAIDGSYEAWPKGSRSFRRHPIRLVYGPPLDVTGMKADAVVKLIDQSIRTLFDRLRSGQMNDKRAAQPLE